jgi:hypothetical protein
MAQHKILWKYCEQQRKPKNSSMGKIHSKYMAKI